MDFLKRTWVEINLDNALYNLQAIRSVCDKPLIAVIKANAYGHGAVEMAKFYCENGIEHFAVSNVEEAVELRQGGIEGEILILGYTPCSLANQLTAHRLTQTVFSFEYAKELSNNLSAPINIHIKLDTGMGRIGLNCRNGVESCLAQIKEIISLPKLQFNGLFTHFCSADSEEPNDRAFVDKQYKLFCEAVNTLKNDGYSFMAHCCNSAGILLDNDKHCDAVRPGIILFGLFSSADVKPPVHLRPVMTLKTTVAMVKDIDKDTYISYGRTFKSAKKMTVATLPIGYADGYLRAFSDKAEVLIKDKRAKVLGRVCMDQIIVDISDIPSVNVGDEVVLFGEKDITANDLAKTADTIGYELLCGIARRVTRVYIKDNKICDIHKMI